jgi:hypothetical protein
VFAAPVEAVVHINGAGDTSCSGLPYDRLR